MPKIIIGNVDNEVMVGDPESLSPTTLAKASIVANRLAWLVRPGDILVLPYPLSPAMLAYIGEILGIDVADVAVVVPEGAATQPRILTFDTLFEPGVIDAVRRLVAAGPDDWSVIAYYHTAAVATFAAALGLNADGPADSFLVQGGAEMFNSKAIFRKLATGRGLPVADGRVVATERQLAEAIDSLIPATGSVIVKQDLNAGGEGNVVVTTGPDGDFAGALEVHAGVGRSDVARLAGALFRRMTGPRNSYLVVESYVASRAVVYAEFEVPRAGAPRYLNHGIMRMEPLWVGFEMPGALGAGEAARLIGASAEFARLTADLGYAGLVNMDAMVREDGSVVFSEINGRAGGCTHIHRVAEGLVGADWLERATVLTRNGIAAPSWPELVALLEAERLHFDPERGTGALILTEDLRATGTIETMVVAPEPGTAAELERRLLDALAGTVSGDRAAA